MGLFASKESKRSYRIQIKINKDCAKETLVKKLLVLGAGASGKSTLVRQCIELYGAGYSVEDRARYTGIIYSNIYDGFKKMIELAEKKEVDLDVLRGLERYSLPPMLKQDVQTIKKGWKDPKVQATWAQYHLLEEPLAVLEVLHNQLPKFNQYFVEHIDRISQEDYCPSFEDLLHMRARTTGINEVEFVIDAVKFKLVDVGGQRTERKKWIHCFESMDAILFVAALTDYCQLMFEDNVNRLEDSLSLFYHTVRNKFLRKTNFILFLNKADLFATTVEKGPPITRFFPDFEGYGNPRNPEDVLRFIRHLYKSQWNPSRRRHLFCHVVTAIDTRNMHHVLRDVQRIVMQEAIQKAGLA